MPKLSQEKIKLIVYDFDGVMTDNHVHVTQSGKEFVTCNRGDGLGVGMIKRAGIQQIILSTETNHVVRKRAEKLGLDAINASADKRESLRMYCHEHQISPDQVLYVGNDMNDFGVMQEVGLTACPADAHPGIKRIARWHAKANGGEGVIRELADYLLSDADTGEENHHDLSVRKRDSMLERISEQLEDGISIRWEILQNTSWMSWLADLAEAAYRSLERGGKIIFAGNGGSFSDAQHLSAEFVGHFMMERGPLASICLGTNNSLLTAVGNDYSFDDIFSRELQCLASDKDTLILISTSGNSGNILNSARMARETGIPVFGFTGGNGGILAQLVSSFIVPSAHTARIQEMHITIGHILCDLIDSHKNLRPNHS